MASAWGSFELTCRGAADGRGLAWVGVAAADGAPAEARLAGAGHAIGGSGDADSGSMTPANGSTRKSQSYGITPADVRRSAGRSSWMVKYSTGYERPGAGPHTGPEARKAPPAGSGATKVDLPVA